MLPQQIAQSILDAVQAAQTAGTLPAFAPPAADIDRPRSLEHGDFATNWALKAAKLAGMPPLALAAAVVAHLPSGGPIQSASVAPPGFINLRLDPAWLAEQVRVIRQAGDRFGNIDLGAGQRLQVEFVSANPTGPIHFGGARNAAIGDTLARVLEAAGYQVHREFYINDAGTQIANYGASILARYLQALGRDVPFPEQGYQGAYIADYAARAIEAEGDRYLDMPEAEAAAALGAWGVDIALASLRVNLGRLGVHFDTWFSEQSLYADDSFATLLADLDQRGLIVEKDGARWLATSQLGSDRDEVLIRSNGQSGYYASDLAYHYDKFVRRGFDRVIDVWAVDHQNQARRMPFLMKALNLDPARLDIVIYDLVKLVESGVDEATGEATKTEVKQSKRKGTFISLDEVLDEYLVPPDAIRFILLTRSNEQVIEFDTELVKKASSDNPVYYVQYAHARICSILRQGEERGLRVPPVGQEAGLGLLTHPTEQALVTQMLRLPELVAQVTQFLAPHHLPHYAMELARAFHAFYHECPVLGAGDEALSLARLALADAARITLARTLSLMGVSAPEQM
ncbi:MAG: arginine--tRNA ligase [Ardenticatenia bacterium]|nr:arginine--tRNA ligase [Ardenticatenia bacterium]